MVYFHHRRWVLERKLASSDVPKDVQINLIKDLERKETEFMRLKRNKICVDDFELLTVIGRGAFGEVSIVQNAHGDWLSYSLYFISFFLSKNLCYIIVIGIFQVRLCREKKSGNIYAMKKLKKSEMLMRGQVSWKISVLSQVFLLNLL